MTKTTNINIQVDFETKSNAEKLFAGFGITLTDAINIFLHKSIMEGGLPFEMKHPRYNIETENAMKETIQIINEQIKTKKYSSAHELFEELDNEMDNE